LRRQPVAHGAWTSGRSAAKPHFSGLTIQRSDQRDAGRWGRGDAQLYRHRQCTLILETANKYTDHHLPQLQITGASLTYRPTGVLYPSITLGGREDSSLYVVARQRLAPARADTPSGWTSVRHSHHSWHFPHGTGRDGITTATLGFSITIVPTAVLQTTSLPSGEAGAPLQRPLSATGGFRRTTGGKARLPHGLEVNPSTGLSPVLWLQTQPLLPTSF